MDSRLTVVQWRRALEIFERIADLPPRERQLRLEQECSGNPALLDQVQALISSDNAEGASLTGVIARAASDAVETGALAEGDRIGAYRIVRELGHGGMGSVYLAVRDDDQYRKQVAIKLVRSSLRRQDALARFRNERQILANLEHPNIARLLDGGATPAGLPYVVMEYVDGEPIHSYCVARALTIEQRLELFVKVCHAVRYAHQNLIVHCDIKPGNILVTAEGEPKLLDFGIAKLLQGGGSDFLSMETLPHGRPMTLPYASPEQVRGEPVTTATDVYQLGILLYELLTGRRPFETETREASGLERLICEAQPEKPSTSVFRTTDPHLLKVLHGSPRKLSGDLDNIVLMALRKEPERRYSSVEQFALDIRRYLDGYPVSARQDSWSYRTAKFAGRHKAAVTVSALFLVVLAGFSIGMAVLARRFALERDKARAVSSLMERMFQVADPSEARGNSITAREVLDRGADNIDSGLQAQPEVRAELQETIGRVYQGLGLYERSTAILQKALDTRLKLLGESDTSVAQSQALLAFTYQNRGQLAESEKLYRQALDTLRKVRGDDDLETASTMVRLGNVLRVSGKLDEAEQQHRKALEVRLKRLDSHDLTLAESEQFLAQVLHDKARYVEAEPLFRRSLETRRAQLGTDHPLIAESLNNLALLLNNEGRYQEAEPLYRESLAIRKKVFGPEHPDTANSLNNLGILLAVLDHKEEAEPLLREALRIRLKVLGPAHQNLGNTMKNLADLLHAKGEDAEAEALYRQSAEIVKQRTGEMHPFYTNALNGLGVVLLEEKHFPEAEPLLEKTLELRRKIYGEDHPRVAESLLNLGRMKFAQGKVTEAAALFRQAEEIYQRKLGPEHPDNALAFTQLGRVLIAQSDWSGAETLLRQALDLRLRAFPARHALVSESRAALAACLSRTPSNE